MCSSIPSRRLYEDYLLQALVEVNYWDPLNTKILNENLSEMFLNLDLLDNYVLACKFEDLKVVDTKSNVLEARTYK